MGMGKLGLFSLLTRKRPSRVMDVKEKVAEVKETPSFSISRGKSSRSTGDIISTDDSQSVDCSPSAVSCITQSLPYCDEREHGVPEHLSDPGVYFKEEKALNEPNGLEDERSDSQKENCEDENGPHGGGGSDIGGQRHTFESDGCDVSEGCEGEGGSMGHRRSGSEEDLSRCGEDTYNEGGMGCHLSDPGNTFRVLSEYDFGNTARSAPSEGGDEAWTSQPTTLSSMPRTMEARNQERSQQIEQDRRTTCSDQLAEGEVERTTPSCISPNNAPEKEVLGGNDYSSELSRPLTGETEGDSREQGARSAPEVFNHNVVSVAESKDRNEDELLNVVEGIDLKGADANEQRRLLTAALLSGRLSGGSMARVREWVSRVAEEGSFSPDDIEQPQLFELSQEEELRPSPVLPVLFSSGKKSMSSGHLTLLGGQSSIVHEGFGLESTVGGGSGALLDMDVEYANRCAKTLDRSAGAANFPCRALKVVPALASFHYLKSLCLSHNAIGRIHAGTLPRSLHSLDLSHNRLVAIEGLRDMTRLRVLNLSHNRLTRIGHGLASCTSTRELYLAGNKISEVEGLHRLLKLAVLDLGANKLTSTKALSQLAANYGSMQSLNLAGNPIHVNLGEDAFKRFITGLLPHLIYLNHNSVKTISAREAAADGSRTGLSGAQVRSGRASTRAPTGSKKSSGGHHRNHSSGGGIGSVRSSSRMGGERAERVRRRGVSGTKKEETSASIRTSKRSSGSWSLAGAAQPPFPVDVETVNDGSRTPDLSMGRSILRSRSMSRLQG